MSDLYSSVYSILDDAKGSHSLVKLYKGSHAASSPYEMVGDFAGFFHAERRGPLAFAVSAVGSRPDSAGVADLAEFDAMFRPRVSFRAAFEVASQSRRPTESDADFLRYVVQRRHMLSAYRGGTSGFDDEARAFAATHFDQLGFSAGPDDVLIFTGGFKGVFGAFCASLMCRRFYDEVRLVGGVVLTPAGYYQSLRLAPPLFGGRLDVVPELTGAVVADWLRLTAGHPGRAIYVPLVNNANGRVLTRDRAYDIAAAVLAYNLTSDEPVFVLGDDVYVGSYLDTGIDPYPVGAVSGDDLGNAGLGRMSDYTVSVVTPSKTFASPTTRIAFAHTTSAPLRRSLNHFRTVLSYSRVPQSQELAAVMALCVTPDNWIHLWNGRYRARYNFLRAELDRINDSLGFTAFQIANPEGGWYIALHISPKVFLDKVASSVDAFAVLLHYGETRDTGIAMLPGELFGYRDSGLVLRGTLAVDYPELRRFVSRLCDMAFRVRGWPHVIDRATKTARAVVDVDAILNRVRY